MDGNVSTFEAQARRYCSLIEGSEYENSWVFAHACLIQVLRLYDSALQLPEIEPESPDLLPGINRERWQAVRKHVARRLARDHYWETFEPLEESKPEPVVGSLSDDLADIWRDLKRGIADDRTTSVSDAVWHWRFSFETHWGRHAAGAIAALHALCFGEFADPSRPQMKPISH